MWSLRCKYSPVYSDMHLVAGMGAKWCGTSNTLDRVCTDALTLYTLLCTRASPSIHFFVHTHQPFIDCFVLAHHPVFIALYWNINPVYITLYLNIPSNWKQDIHAESKSFFPAYYYKQGHVCSLRWYHHWVATGERRLDNDNLQNRKSTIKQVISGISRRLEATWEFLSMAKGRDTFLAVWVYAGGRRWVPVGVTHSI